MRASMPIFTAVANSDLARIASDTLSRDGIMACCILLDVCVCVLGMNRQQWRCCYVRSTDYNIIKLLFVSFFVSWPTTKVLVFRLREHR